MSLTWPFWSWSWDQWATFFVVFAAPGQVVFVVSYFLLSPWWVERIGRALMMKSAALGLILALLFVRYFWEVPIPRPVAAFTYGAVFLAVYYQLSAFAQIRSAPEARGSGLVFMAARRLRRNSAS